jgi:hypothetical protein
MQQRTGRTVQRNHLMDAASAPPHVYMFGLGLFSHLETLRAAKCVELQLHHLHTYLKEC